MNPIGDLDALVSAVRAEESARQAHERLDRMNGSIDRLNSIVAKTSGEIGTKIDGVLLHLAQSTGFDEARSQRRTESRSSSQFWLNLAVAVVAAGAAVLGVKLT